MSRAWTETAPTTTRMESYVMEAPKHTRTLTHRKECPCNDLSDALWALNRAIGRSSEAQAEYLTDLRNGVWSELANIGAVDDDVLGPS